MKKRWIFRLLNVGAVTLIIASIFVLLTVVMTPQGEVPKIFGLSVLRVMTGSMEPEIPENAVLLVQETEVEAIQPGDVITFFSPDPSLNGALNTHRVQRIEQRNDQLCFITKGDANILEDQQPVTPDMLVGKVIFVSAGLGVVVRLLSNPLVFIGLILAPLLVLLILNVYRTVHTAAEIARQEEEAAVREAIETMKTKSNPKGEEPKD